ncbi:MAG: methylmalonyl-CoA mutase family protein, partial [Bdellovibrionota bacterium]
IASESNVAQVVDPLGGSWFVESLTTELEKRTFEYLGEIDRRGGTIACIESGYIQTEIANSAYDDQKKIDQGRIQVVGVNVHADQAGGKKIDLLRIPPELERAAVERVRAYRAKRSETTARAALKAVSDGAKSGANLMALILAAARAGATLGEIADAMRTEFGLFQEYSGF